jgi:hypothetical protein
MAASLIIRLHSDALCKLRIEIGEATSRQNDRRDRSAKMVPIIHPIMGPNVLV